MIYAGIDIGKAKHCIAAISATGAVRLKPVFIEQSPEGFEALAARLRRLGNASQVKIGMEASGHYWTHLYHFLNEAGWTVELFNPVLSSAQGRCHLRGRKTDKDDALAIAKTLRDGGYTPWALPPDEHNALKLLCRQRTFIVAELSNAKRRLSALRDMAFPELAGFFSDAHAKAPAALLREAPAAGEVPRCRCAGSLRSFRRTAGGAMAWRPHARCAPPPRKASPTAGTPANSPA